MPYMRKGDGQPKWVGPYSWVVRLLTQGYEIVPKPEEVTQDAVPKRKRGRPRKSV